MDQNNSLESEDNDANSGGESTGSLESTDSTSSLEGVESTGKIVDKVTETKKLPFFKRLMKGTNIYLLLFILLLVIAGAIATAVYLSSKKATDNTVPTQTLSQDALKQLATSDVTVGQAKQTLNVQSNAVFAGKVLIRDSLEVAGTIQVGGSLNVPGITVSGNSIFEQIQINKGLSVAGDTSVQGQLTVAKNLTVGGGATFGGAVSAPQLNVNTLQLNGNLTLTKHISAGGATPSRSNGDALGSGGTTAVSGSDIAGSVNVNTGSGPNAGCFLTVNFTTKYNATPHVIVTPIGSAAANLAYYVNRSTSNFSICAANTPPSNASFGFDYFIVE
jgi:cytoskeletal protein CcmA (bactofilin family)